MFKKKQLCALIMTLLMISCGDEFINDPRIDCDIHQGPCVKTINGQSLEFDLAPKPVHQMKPLRVKVALKGGETPDALTVNFTMPDMDMGVNQAILKKLDGNRYEGGGILPACSSGNRIWKASVTTDSRRPSVEFTFYVLK
jgi:hypothetical protein